MATSSDSGVGTTPSPAGPGPRPRRIGMPVLLLALAVILVAVTLAWWAFRGPSGPYAEATETLPDSTLRSSFIDWTAVRDQVDVPDLEEATDPDQVNRFLGEAFDLDLVTGSTQLDVIPGLATVFGYSLTQVEWETYGQSPDGAVSVLKVDDTVDFDEVAGNLEQAGYSEPGDDDGVWRGSADLVSQFESPMGTLQLNVLLLADERLILTSDAAAYLEGVREVVAGDEASLREVPGVDSLLEAVPDALAAQLWARDFACEDLSMSQADRADADEGARLVEAAGGVTPLDGMVLARTGGEQATVAMWFDSEADADHDLQPRTDLAQGPAPGQGGDFTERFALTSSQVEGRLVTMRLRAQTESLMGDLGQGPVLFAAC